MSVIITPLLHPAPVRERGPTMTPAKIRGQALVNTWRPDRKHDVGGYATGGWDLTIDRCDLA